jgi:quercetin dioxygenase-like cupin family protein
MSTEVSGTTELAGFASTLGELLGGLDPRQRNEALALTLGLLARHNDPGQVDGVSADPPLGVRVAHWAHDGGIRDGVQHLGCDLGSLDVSMAKTRAATGRPLVTNGFLGADLIRLPAGEGFAPHTHAGDHLLIVVGGRGTVTTPGYIQETEPGEAFLIDGAAPHAVGAITDHVIIAVGASHRAVDSTERQTIVTNEELFGVDAPVLCGPCDLQVASYDDLVRSGCPHNPGLFHC